MNVLTRKRQKGFTLVELMIVIAIIAILAAIAIPMVLRYRIRGYNTAALADLKNGFTSAQSHYSAHVGVPVTLALLKSAGYTQTANVILTVNDGNEGTLSISTTHANGDTTYSISSDGTITH